MSLVLEIPVNSGKEEQEKMVTERNSSNAEQCKTSKKGKTHGVIKSIGEWQ